jgi:hypothetical protein
VPRGGLLEREEEGGEVVALVEGAGLGVEGGSHFFECGAGVFAGELRELGAVVFVDEFGGVLGIGEGGFEAVGVEEEGVAFVKLEGLGRELFTGEDAEEGAVEFEVGGGAVGAEEEGLGVSGARPGEGEGAGVEDGVDDGDELGVGEFLGDEVVVEACEGFVGGDEAVAGGGDFLGFEGAFEKDGEECCGHAVADGIGDEEAEVVFVEADDVVDIAGDVGSGAEEEVEGGGAEGGEGSGEEVGLESGGEAEFFIELGEARGEGGVALAEGGVFALEGGDEGACGDEAGETSGEFVGGASGGDGHDAVGGTEFVGEAAVGFGVGEEDGGEMVGDEGIEDFDEIAGGAVEGVGGDEEEGGGEAVVGFVGEPGGGVCEGGEEEFEIGAGEEGGEGGEVVGEVVGDEEDAGRRSAEA